MSTLFQHPSPRRAARRALLNTLMAGTMTALLIGTQAIPALAAPTPSPEQSTLTISSAALRVTLARDFPRVISYDLGGTSMSGQATPLDSFSINGTPHQAHTTVTATSDTASYSSTFDDLPGVRVESELRAGADTLDFTITEIVAPAATPVHEISIPDHSLVSVSSNEAQATLARTAIDTNTTRQSDRFIDVAPTTAVDPSPVGTPYGFVGHAGLVAGIVTNATDDTDVEASNNSNNRLLTRITAGPGEEKIARLSVGNWTWSPKGATDPRVTTFETPRATVVLAKDRNGSGDVTWQDGAIAHRAAMTTPLGSERVPERVVQHVPFNFGSTATNPFLKSADNVKRIAANTDGLGQWVLQKGYGSEGHDSANTDYGSNYNIRAGGLDDFNELTRIAKDHNADVAVHVNATEAYAQSLAFSDRLVQGGGIGWNWLNQSYIIDQRFDLGSGGILDRFAQLKKEAPGVKTVYIDVYHSDGWLAHGLASELRTMGFEVATEWAYKFEGSALWSHWANDKNYGGATNKGITSDIVRFIANSHRDVWNSDELLGGEELVEFEGWTGQNDWNAFLDTVWSKNLPTKFLQHFDLLEWTDGESARLTDDVVVRRDNGIRTISMGGRDVLVGDTYLLPWGGIGTDGTSSPARAEKMYYFSESGGTHRFEITGPFAGESSLTQYALTDQGRVKLRDVEVNGGVVDVSGDAGTAYVLEATTPSTKPVDFAYGEGTSLVDPGFNNGDVATWHPTGTVSIDRTDNGDNVLRFGSAGSSISQDISGLTPGARYSFSADVEIEPTARRGVTISAGPDQPSIRSFDLTPLQNTNNSDSKRGTFAQRTSVSFVADGSGRARVSLAAEAGEPAVTIDDLRVMRDTSTVPEEDGVVAASDFEGNQPGWGPFYKGALQGFTDPRGSISVLREPYSQKGWKNVHDPYDRGAVKGQAVDDVLTGQNSLKMHDVDVPGLAFRTTPASVDFLPGHEYRVSFTYQTNVADQWQWVRGTDTLGSGGVTSSVVATHPMTPALTNTTFTDQFVAGCDSTWVGLNHSGTAPTNDVVIDDVRIIDLGERPGGAVCATIAGQAGAEFSAGITTPYVTTFTNREEVGVTNVQQSIAGVPEGWTVQVADERGNIFANVAAGASVSTTWLITPPAGVEPGAVTLRPEATYFHACAVKSSTSEAKGEVSAQPIIPTGTIIARADSENGAAGQSEGPATNVLDGDIHTIWHTRYTPSVDAYPHSVTLDLRDAASISGFGYQARQDGHKNGLIGSYRVEGSADGSTWTELATGTFTDSRDMQRVTFPEATLRSVRLIAEDAINGQPFAAAAEMRLYGTPSVAPAGYAPAERPADDLTECSTPTPTPSPTADPGPQPTPTTVPLPSPEPTAVPTPTAAPQPSPDPTNAAEPTPDPGPTSSSDPNETPAWVPSPTTAPPAGATPEGSEVGGGPTGGTATAPIPLPFGLAATGTELSRWFSIAGVLLAVGALLSGRVHLRGGHRNSLPKG